MTLGHRRNATFAKGVKTKKALRKQKCRPDRGRKLRLLIPGRKERTTPRGKKKGRACQFSGERELLASGYNGGEGRKMALRVNLEKKGKRVKQNSEARGSAQARQRDTRWPMEWLDGVQCRGKWGITEGSYIRPLREKKKKKRAVTARPLLVFLNPQLGQQGRNVFW